MFGNRRVRIAVGIFMLAAVWNLLWSRATSYVSIDAVIDAPVVAVRAPSDGTILVASPALGTGVSPETVLMEVAPVSDNPETSSRLSGEAIVARAEAMALNVEIDATKTEISELEVRASAEQRIEIAYLTQKLSEAEEVRRQRAIAWDRAKEALERARDLSNRGAVSGVKTRSAELDLALADALLAEADAYVAGIILELEAVEAGHPSPSGIGRRDFALGRLDDMQLHLNDLKTRLSIAIGRIRALEFQMADLDGNSSVTTHFAPRAAANGVIWRASPPNGASTTQGSKLAEVLDCSRRFVEVLLSERAFEQIEVGAPATVRLKGADASFTASVALRRASGVGSALSNTTAGQAPIAEQNGVRIYLHLPPIDGLDPENATRFCDVGRTAEVSIARPALVAPFSAVVGFLRTTLGETRSLAARALDRDAG